MRHLDGTNSLSPLRFIFHNLQLSRCSGTSELFRLQILLYPNNLIKQEKGVQLVGYGL